MSVVCAHCDTENREGAMFCRGCVAKLPAFVATGPAAIDVMKAFPRPTDPSRKAGGGSGATASWMNDADEPAGAAVDVGSRVFWMRVAAIAVAITVLIVGWYSWVTRRAEPNALPMSVATSKEMMPSASAATPVRAAVIAAAKQPEPQSLQPLQTVQPSETLGPGEALAPFGVLGSADVDRTQQQQQQQRQQQQGSAFMDREATTPARERSSRLAMIPQQTPTEPSARVAAADPRTACASLNFVMASRCEAQQCAKPAYSRHPHCAAVRELTRRDVARRDLAF
ncbi:MAG: hypothetical protein ABW220_01255 [Burkholderiaceae bacterium]